MQVNIEFKKKIKEYFDYYEKNVISVINNCSKVTQ